MMKFFIRLLAMALAVLPSSLIAQQPAATPAATAHAATAPAEIPVSAADANDLLRLQRDIQSHQLQQQAADEQAKKDIQALVDKYNAALNGVRVRMGIPTDAQFDGYKISFVVPAKPTAVAAKSASASKP